jgi:hypothetical protein
MRETSDPNDAACPRIRWGESNEEPQTSTPEVCATHAQFQANKMDGFEQHIEEMKELLDRLLAATPYSFDESLRSNLPEEPGLYMIFTRNDGLEEVLRAGRTSGAGGLRQRVYQNHLMGNQSGNLRAQLVGAKICKDLTEAKIWTRANCWVRFLVVKDGNALRWGEHFILSVLRPTFCD